MTQKRLCGVEIVEKQCSANMPYVLCIIFKVFFPQSLTHNGYSVPEHSLIILILYVPKEEGKKE